MAWQYSYIIITLCAEMQTRSAFLYHSAFISISQGGANRPSAGGGVLRCDAMLVISIRTPF